MKKTKPPIFELDRHGYPTDTTLRAISKWHPAKHGSFVELLKAIKPIWAYSNIDGYFASKDTESEITKEPEITFSISTAGWSGNEEIIGALRENIVFWSMCWYSERRGGHFVFKVRKGKKL